VRASSIGSALPHELTPVTVDSVVGIDADDVASEMPTATADASTSDGSPTPSPNTVAATTSIVSTSKRASRLGAVIKEKHDGPSLSAEPKPQGFASDDVATGGGGGIEDAVPMISSDIAESLAPRPVVCATGTLNCIQLSAAAITEAEADAAAALAPPDVIAQHDVDPLAPVAATHAPPTAADALTQLTKNSIQPPTQDSYEVDDAADDVALLSTNGMPDSASDKLKKRELQLEVSACACYPADRTRKLHVAALLTQCF
jgi:hypothetical protein